MKKMRTVLIFLIVFVFVLILSSAGLAALNKVKVGIAIPAADHGWAGGIVWYAKKGIADWQKKDKNIDFFLATADDATQQVNQVGDLMAKGIDALIIMVHDSTALTPIAEKASKEGIFIVTVNSPLKKSIEDIYITGDNPGLGRVSAKWMAEELKGQGDIVLLEGIPGMDNSKRIEAFKEVIKEYPGIKILDSQPTYKSTQKGFEIMESYLQKYKKIDAVWAQDDDILKGVLQAYQESGRKDIKFLLGGGGSKDIIKMIMAGDPLIRADVTYSPSMIATGISMAVMSLRGQKLTGFYQNNMPSKIILSAELITRENAKSYYTPESVF